MGRKRVIKAKEPVAVRFRDLANGNKSIYLDINVNGKRVREFLKLYLIPESDISSRIANDNSLKIANTIKARRIEEINDGKFNVNTNQSRKKVLLSDWMQTVANRKQSKGNITSMNYTRLHLIEYKGDKVLLSDVDENFCLGFIEYLSTAKNFTVKDKRKKKGANAPTIQGKRIAKTTATLYYNQFNSALYEAVRDGYIDVNPNTKIRKEAKKAIAYDDKSRDYLTVEELTKLINTPCSYVRTRRLFLFACFCGLRISDIKDLKWQDVKFNDGGVVIEKIMIKTKKHIILPLNQKAVDLLPERGKKNKTSPVFADIPAPSTISYELKAWAKEAEIDKYVCFHMSRHTFATTVLNLGADLYTVSKLLGHQNLKVTQVYADIVSKTKQDAVNLLDKIEM